MNIETINSGIDGLSDKRDNLFLFIDWANVYKEGKKLHNPGLFASKECITPSREEVTNTATPHKTTTAETEQKPLHTTESVEMKNIITLEQALAGFVLNLKKYDNTNLSSKYGINDLFNILRCLNTTEDLQKVKEYEQKLATSVERKSFVEKYRSKAENEGDTGERYVLAPNWLQLISCLWNVYDLLPLKRQCYIFLSHRPGEKHTVEKNKIYQRMIKKYSVLFHERITTVIEQKAKAEEGETDEVVVREKEKGVDVSIAVEITNAIRKSIEKRCAGRACGESEKSIIDNKEAGITVVLVSGDSDFRPVVEYAIDNNVSVDIWAWKTGVSAVYKKYLEKLSKTKPVRLFYLDRYLYQLGFVVGLFFKYEVKFESTDQSKIAFSSLSHFTIAERLTRDTALLEAYETQQKGLYAQKQLLIEKIQRITRKIKSLKKEVELFHTCEDLHSDEEKGKKRQLEELENQKNKLIPEEQRHIAKEIKKLVETRKSLEKESTEGALKFKTSDFIILWGRNGFTIAFFAEEMREKFRNYLNISTEKLATNLRNLNMTLNEITESQIDEMKTTQKQAAADADELSSFASDSDEDAHSVNDNDGTDDED